MIFLLKWMVVAALGFTIWKSYKLVSSSISEKEPQEFRKPPAIFKKEPIFKKLDRHEIIFKLSADLEKQMQFIQKFQTNKVVETSDFSEMVQMVSHDSLPVIINFTQKHLAFSDSSLLTYLQKSRGVRNRIYKPENKKFKNFYVVKNFNQGKVLHVFLEFSKWEMKSFKSAEHLTLSIFTTLFEVIKEFKKEYGNKVTFILKLDQFKKSLSDDLYSSGDTKLSPEEYKLRSQIGVCEAILANSKGNAFILSTADVEDH
ncbi:hypothetical protein TUBRATIS_12820 [Tubulinosema ratisbonensis]|uniref:Uncharacterized protein n=1 Tax=Tubulinosema ratisbonensis TaxID=291195 RepID=A0A437AM57_9MICR|nr:hypothetical protein TUBRATIS_12820 [Tubulinosema ratisbonensis]